MQEIKNIFRKKYIWFLMVFVVVLSVYVFTLCPSIYLEDSAEFVTVSETLGIPHPSGYPLYALLGKLFITLLPIGTVAWQVNFMSAFFGALTCAFLFLAIQEIFENFIFKKQEKNKLLINYFIPSVTAIIFAFTPTFWSQAVVAEVYTLNSFFVVLCLWLLLLWSEKLKTDKKAAQRILIWFAFIFGLSATNHQLMLLLAPVFVIYIIWQQPKIIKNLKLILILLIVFILGLSVYVYLPWRASQSPDFNWGDPQSWHDFKAHVLREQYNDLNFGWDKFFHKDKLPLVAMFFNELVTQFTWLGLILIIGGMIINFFKNKKVFWLLFGTFIFNSLLIILLRSGLYSTLNDYIFRVYYLPAFMVLVIWLAICLVDLINYLFNFLKKSSQLIKNIFLISVSVLLIFLPVAFLKNNWDFADRSNFYLAEEWSKNVLESLEPDAYLLAHNDQPALDSMIFALMYQQVVNDVRPDVRLINLSGISGKFYRASGDSLQGFFEWDEVRRKNELADYVYHVAKSEGVAGYVLYPVGNFVEHDIVTQSNGWAYKVYENLEQAQKNKFERVKVLSIKNLEEENLKYNMYYSDLLSDIYLAWASYYLEVGQREVSQKYLLKSIEYDASGWSFNYQAFVEHRGKINNLIIR